jgi:hypothetical protein
MPDTTLSQAIKEAYASAPTNQVIYHTLELRHSTFSSPIRVVRDYADLIATLESSAPINPSTAVTFTAFNFDLTKPEVSATGVPQVTIQIDNADRAIVANIEAALTTTELVQFTYREFISTDLSVPQNNPPLTMTILSIKADNHKVTAVAGYPNLNNIRFPRDEYDAQTYPGLVA